MASWQDFAAGYGDMPAIGSLSGVHNSKLYDTMLGQIAKAIGYTGQTAIPGTYQFENVNEGGTFTDTAMGKQASPDFLKALEAYQFQRTSPLQGSISRNAQEIGTFTAGNKDTGFDKFANVAVPVALAAIGGQLAGGLLSGTAGGSGAITGGGGMTAGGSAGYGSIGGTLGGAGGTTLGVAGGGMSAGAGLNSALLQGLGTASVGGGLLSAIPGATNAVSWMKQNPALGRLLMGGATSLLSAGGSSGSPDAAAAPSGPPVTWNTPIQQGLLPQVQQYAPAPVKQNKPAGLLAQGQANDGAWRYLKG